MAISSSSCKSDWNSDKSVELYKKPVKQITAPPEYINNDNNKQEDLKLFKSQLDNIEKR